MRATLFILVSLAVVATVYSAVSIYPKVEGKPGCCWADITGPMECGEQKDLAGLCSQANCRTDGTIQVFTCGAVSNPNGTTETDFSKPYPECCPQPI